MRQDIKHSITCNKADFDEHIARIKAWYGSPTQLVVSVPNILSTGEYQIKIFRKDIEGNETPSFDLRFDMTKDNLIATLTENTN